MNIAFVNSTRKWGGVKTWSLDMACALREQGHRCHILGRAGDFVDKALALGLPARAVRFGFDYNPPSVAAFAAYFRRQAIDVVVLNVAKDLRTAGAAARLLGIRAVQHVGSAADFDDTPMVRLAQRLVRPRMLCCSDFVRRGIVEHVPWLKNWEVAALHPGVRVPAEPDFPAHEPPVVVTTSQLNDDKCHEYVLYALGRLKRQGLDFRMVVAGSGKLADVLRAIALEHGIAENIEWTGFTSDVAGVLRRGDIFVLPTPKEPLGIALQEAMAAGLAPVARNGGGVPEIWPEACREFLVASDYSADGLEAALRRLLSMTAEERLGYRRAAWAHAKASFDLPGQAARFARWLAEAPGP